MDSNDKVTINDKVIVKCPVYKNGRKLTGIVTGYHSNGISIMVRIDGNSKSTRFAKLWLTLNTLN